MWNEGREMSGNKRIDEDPQRAYIKGLYLLRSKLKTFVLQMTLLRKGKGRLWHRRKYLRQIYQAINLYSEYINNS